MPVVLVSASYRRHRGLDPSSFHKDHAASKVPILERQAADQDKPKQKPSNRLGALRLVEKTPAERQQQDTSTYERRGPTVHDLIGRFNLALEVFLPTHEALSFQPVVPVSSFHSPALLVEFVGLLSDQPL